MSPRFYICGLLFLALNHSSCSAWAPASPSFKKSVPSRASSFDRQKNAVFAPEEIVNERSLSTSLKLDSFGTLLSPCILALFVLPESATAATSGANAIGSAFAAYGHYLSILVCAVCITVERFTIKANMSDEEEGRIAIADTVYGLAGLFVAYTGYVRVVEYGKGWEFYSHEPIFWLKIALVGVLGGLSFFNTIIIVPRAIAKAKGEPLEPMTLKLADKMNKVCTAELSALGSIPLTATLMSRGVLYSNDIPWQVGAGFAFLIFGGASYYYASAAINWTEDIIDNSE